MYEIEGIEFKKIKHVIIIVKQGIERVLIKIFM